MPRAGLAFIVFLFSIYPAVAAPLVTDGFESDTLSDHWLQTRIIPSDLEIQDKITRSGRRAVKISLHKGDHHEQSPGNNPTERAELLEAKRFESAEGKTYTFAFSMFIPKDFPIVPTRLILAQWKQRCEDPCKKDNPVIALRFVSGELFISVQTGDKKRKLFGTTEKILGRWIDLKFKIHFSRGPNGVVQAWLNGKRVLDYHGANSYPESYGYPNPSTYFFKMGLYRDRMDAPMTIYFDDYQKSAEN